MGRVIQQINLYQSIFRREKPKFDASQMLLALLALSVLLGLLSVWQYLQLADSKATLAVLNQQQQQQQAELDQLKEKLGKNRANQMLEARKRSLSDELRDANLLANLLANEINVPLHPYSAYFRSFAETPVNGLWLTELQLANNAQQLKVTGYAIKAEKVTTLLQALKTSQVFAGLTFADVKMTKQQVDDKALVRFEMLTARATGDSADVQ